MEETRDKEEGREGSGVRLGIVSAMEKGEEERKRCWVDAVGMGADEREE